MTSFTNSPGTPSSQPGAGQHPTDSLKENADGVRDQMSQAAHAAGDKARAAASDLRHEAEGVASEAAEHARAFAEANKGKVAGQIETFGSALKRAAEELDEGNQGAMAGYVRQAAQGVHDISTTINDKGVEDLIGMVGGFARRQPAAFVGGAALIGFLASRFALSSASGGATTHPSTVPPAYDASPEDTGTVTAREPFFAPGETNGGADRETHPGTNGGR